MQEEKVMEKVAFLSVNSWFTGIGFAMIRNNYTKSRWKRKMQIGCTKKLQEFLKKDIIQADQDVDPFYTWSASIMIVNRRRTIVVLHDESRCGFVLYGMTSRHIREIDHIIQTGICDIAGSTWNQYGDN